MSPSPEDLKEIADRRRAVVNYARQGLSIEEIAVRLGVSSRTVQRDRGRMGITGPPPEPLTPEELEAAKAMLSDGAPYAEVARTLKRAQTTLARHLPGHSYDKFQIAAMATLGRQMARMGA